MSKFTTLVCKSAIATVAVAVIGASAGSAEACGYYYKTVTTYVTAHKPVVYYINRYDDCGDAYRVRKVGYKTVRVPITKRVKVTY